MIDGDKKTEIPAILAHVGDTTLSTSLEKDGYKISTIEHLLSALAGTGVDIVLLTAMARNSYYGRKLDTVCISHTIGIIEQAAAKKFIYVTKSVQVNRGDTLARIKPYDGFK